MPPIDTDGVQQRLSASSSSSSSSWKKKKNRGSHSSSHEMPEQCLVEPGSSEVLSLYDKGNNLLPTKRLVTYDFVVRSLRRRFWKALSDDDAIAALKTYQATLTDFVHWLEEEQKEELRKNEEKEHDLAATTGAGSEKEYSKKSKSGRKSGKNTRKNFSPVSNGVNHDGKNEYRYQLLKHHREQKMETEAMIGGSNIPILQSKFYPSEGFIADDYLSPFDDDTYDHPAVTKLPDPVRHAQEQEALREERKRQKRISRQPRMAFRRIFSGKQSAASNLETSGTLDADSIDGGLNSPVSSNEFLDKDNHCSREEEEDSRMTTPLHEAARLGAGNLVRCLLANGGDVNVKNGHSRTAIHMCAGGLTKEERLLLGESTPGRTSTVGIGATVIPEECLELMRQHESSAIPKERKDNGETKKNGKKGLFGKMVSFGTKKEKKNKNIANTTEDEKCPNSDNADFENLARTQIIYPLRLDEIRTERMDSILALLSWSHKDSRDGPSINAVDTHGRTSLHYAAELGRSDVCTAILSNFEVMLTIVDELGARTPCEVAAANGHEALAALLEARALLYVDPYGMEDDMLDTLMAANEAAGNNTAVNKRSNPSGRLVPPFRWFITCSMEEIVQERAKRLEEAQNQLTNVVILEDELAASLEDRDKKPCADSATTTIRNNAFYGARPEQLEPYVKPSSPKSTTSKNSNDAAEAEDSKRKTETQASKSDNDIAEATMLLQYLGEDHHLERYMGHHKWDLSEAVDAFRKNRIDSLAAAGIKLSLDDQTTPLKDDANENIDCFVCQICFDDDLKEGDCMVLRNCKHIFCTDCLIGYIKVCGKDRTPLHSISCPEQGCNAGFSVLDIRALLQNDHPETLARIEGASTDHFITSHPNFRFCTHPGCRGVVHRLRQPKWASANYDETFLNYSGAVCVACPDNEERNTSGFLAGGINPSILTYEGVEDPEYANCRSLQQPRKGHRFCFSCGDTVHWPLTCERLVEWKQRVNEEIDNVDGDDQGDVNALAHKLWLKANTRPCPECNIPIEKNDGCNHMVCNGCLHEFCWICRKDWRLHSNDTGGFFRCNIWQEDDPDRIKDKNDGDDEALEMMANRNTNFLTDTLNDQGYGTSIHSARKAWRKKQEMKRFIHHYTRWEAHKESAILEQKMGDTVCTRLAPVVEAAIDFDGSPAFNFGGKGLSFVHNAFFELAECRSTLRHSYAFSFYRYPSKAFSKPSQFAPSTGYIYGSKHKEKARFERLQSELETLTEQMSDIVARSHLRATQIQITYMTAATAEKRVELNNFIFQTFREEQRGITKQQKKAHAEAQKKERSKKKKSSSSGRLYAESLSPNTQQVSTSAAQVFDTLLQIRDQDYEQTHTPYVANPTARDVSLELAASNDQVQALSEAVRQMGALLPDNGDGSSSGGYDYDYRDFEEHSGNGYTTQMWGCSRCTYMNTGGYRCEMCETLRE